MKNIKICQLCFHEIEIDGRAIRSDLCYQCRVTRKREYNRFRSEVIRTHGQKGWNNYLILVKLFANRNYVEFPFKFKTTELIGLGFSFPNGLLQNDRLTPIIISFGKYRIAHFSIQHSQDGHEVIITQLTTPKT